MPHFQRLEFERFSEDQQVSRSRQYLETLSTRRSVRHVFIGSCARLKSSRMQSDEYLSSRKRV